MKFTDRKEFTHDPELFGRKDVQIALKLTNEYYTRCSARPLPRFFEVDRSPDQIDPLYHVPVNARTQFLRTLDIPAINQFIKPNLSQLVRSVITYQRKDTFWLSHIALQAFDWWPLRGDQVAWSGYRYNIIDVSVPPEAYFGQTGVWTALTVTCIVPADGDAVAAYAGNVLKPADKQRDGLATSA